MFGRLANAIGGLAGYASARADLSRFEREMAELDARMAVFAGMPKDAYAEVARARTASQQASANLALRTAPVSQLAGYGARVQPLVNNGIHLVSDLQKYSRRRLLALRGVGPVTADGILEALARFTRDVQAKARIRPDPDRMSKEDESLLLAVSRLERVRQGHAAAFAAAVNQRQSLDASVDWIRGEATRPGIAYDRAAQKALVSYVQEVIPHVRARSAQIKESCDRIWDPAGLGLPELKQRFSENTAWFYAILDSGSTPIAKAPQAGPPPLASPPRMAPAAPRQPTPTNAPESDRHTQAPSVPYSGIDGQQGGMPDEIARAVEAVVLRQGPLIATLRRYQQFGAQYMIRQERVLLGDDMGLGKTMQVLAAMCHLAAEGKRRFFVVAPNSVVNNWEREIRKHTWLTPHIIHGWDRMDELDDWRKKGGVGITTYGTVGVLEPHIGEVDFLAVDEAHAVKNAKAQRTQAVKAVASKALRVAFMSGTALENRLSELHNLVIMVQPKIKPEADFLLEGAAPAPEEARRRLAPVYLRRTQEDVLAELPEMTKVDELITLSKEELITPEALRADMMGQRLCATVGTGSCKSAKYDRLREILENYRQEGRKVAIFSFFRRVLDDVVAIVGGCEVITGAMSSASRMAAIDTFGQRQGFAVIALQIEAGGVGINLQAAQVVILMEPQLKPSIENQAVARVHRMGQSRKVTVHRLIAQDTIDQDLVKLLEQKQEVFDTYADPSAIKTASSMAVDGQSTQADIEAELAMLAEARRRRLLGQAPGA